MVQKYGTCTIKYGTCTIAYGTCTIVTMIAKYGTVTIICYHCYHEKFIVLPVCASVAWVCPDTGGTRTLTSTRNCHVSWPGVGLQWSRVAH